MTRRISYWSFSFAIALVSGIVLAPYFSFLVPFLIVSIITTAIGSGAFEGTLDDKNCGINTFLTSIFTAVVFIIVAIIMFIAPQVIYRDVHFAWLIVLSIISAIPMVIIASINISEYNWKSNIFGTFSIIVNILATALIITAIIVSINTTYHISKAEDMDVLANAPESNETAFILENDIDFTGKNTRWFGKKKNFKGVFNGQGHTLSNIEIYYDKVKDVPYGDLYNFDEETQIYGMVRKNTGVIMNLNFDSCSFILECDKQSAIICMPAGYLQGSGKVLNCTATNCYLQKEQQSYPISANPEDAKLYFEYKDMLEDILGEN